MSRALSIVCQWQPLINDCVLEDFDGLPSYLDHYAIYQLVGSPNKNRDRHTYQSRVRRYDLKGDDKIIVFHTKEVRKGGWQNYRTPFKKVYYGDLKGFRKYLMVLLMS